MRRLRRTAFALTLLAHCGARSPLREGMNAPDDASSSDANALDVRDVQATIDVATDAVPPDAPAPCPELTLLAGPVIAFATTRGSFATPRVVARAGGFDLFAPLSNADMLGIRGRRMSLSGTPASITFGDVVVLGEDSWTWAEGGTDGTTLALGYNSGGPTFRAWSGAYTSRTRVTLMIPGPVGTSAGVVWSGDRWFTGWNNDMGTSYVAEVSTDGRLLAVPRDSVVHLGRAAPSLAAYGNGAVWAAPEVGGGGIAVRFAPRGRPDVTRRIPVTGAAQSFRLSAWPADPTAAALVWRDAAGAVHLVVVREDGTLVVDRVAIVASSGTARAVEIAPFRDGVVLADVACGDRNPDNGLIGIHRFAADGLERGRGASVPLDCRGPLSLTSIAAGDDIAVAWLTPRPGPLGDRDVNAAVVRCSP